MVCLLCPISEFGQLIHPRSQRTTLPHRGSIDWLPRPVLLYGHPTHISAVQPTFELFGLLMLARPRHCPPLPSARICNLQPSPPPKKRGHSAREYHCAFLRSDSSPSLPSSDRATSVTHTSSAPTNQSPDGPVLQLHLLRSATRWLRWHVTIVPRLLLPTDYGLRSPGTVITRFDYSGDEQTASTGTWAVFWRHPPPRSTYRLGPWRERET